MDRISLHVLVTGQQTWSDASSLVKNSIGSLMIEAAKATVLSLIEKTSLQP